MIVAFVSGSLKTGRSTIAANLAAYLKKHTPVTLLDSDIEQLEGSLLLSHFPGTKKELTILAPTHDLFKCKHCLQCLEKCKGGVFKNFNGKIIVLPERCRNCHACLDFCKEHAVTLKKMPLGTIFEKNDGNLTVVEIRMNESAIKANSLFYHAKSYLNLLHPTIVDTAPFISEYACCSTMNADYFVLVTSDHERHFKQFVQTINFFKEFQKPFGAIINLARSDTSQTANYCQKNNIPLLGTFPFEKDLESGDIAKHKLVETRKWQPLFQSLWERILEETAQ